MRLRNLPATAINLLRLAMRRAGRWTAGARRTATLTGRRTRRAVEGALSARGSLADVAAAAERTRIRTARRIERFDAHVLASLKEERAVLARLREIASGRQPIVLGPWVSEVGYEVLYWVPFLRWFQDRFAVPAQRMVAVSRGGVAWWYTGLASRYLDLLDVYTADEFGRRAEARRAAGDQKQLDPSAWELEIVSDLRTRAGLGDAHVLHPGLMYRLFRGVWHGDRSLDVLMRHTDFRGPAAPRVSEDDWLPERFAAVKFYTGPAMPDEPQTRAQLRGAVARLAERLPIVSLDTGLGLDEHRDYVFGDVPGVIDLRHAMTPATNLGVQSRVMARAALFVGTCGSLAWLSPTLGVPTVAVYADDRFLTSHLYAARYIYRRARAARFSAVNLQALAHVSAA